MQIGCVVLKWRVKRTLELQFRRRSINMAVKAVPKWYLAHARPPG
jgi:hypothetical protein